MLVYTGRTEQWFQEQLFVIPDIVSDPTAQASDLCIKCTNNSAKIKCGVSFWCSHKQLTFAVALSLHLEMLTPQRGR